METEVDGEDEEYNVEYVEVQNMLRVSPRLHSRRLFSVYEGILMCHHFTYKQNFDESDDEEDEIEEAAEKIYEQIQGQSLRHIFAACIDRKQFTVMTQFTQLNMRLKQPLN